jgi:hypothetical protein
MKGQVSVFFLILPFLVFSAALGVAIGAGRFLHGTDKAPATYSGLTVQGLLHHAGSKDGLLVSVLEHCETDDAPRLAAQLDTGDNELTADPTDSAGRGVVDLPEVRAAIVRRDGGPAGDRPAARRARGRITGAGPPRARVLPRPPPTSTRRSRRIGRNRHRPPPITGPPSPGDDQRSSSRRSQRSRAAVTSWDSAACGASFSDPWKAPGHTCSSAWPPACQIRAA